MSVTKTRTPKCPLCNQQTMLVLSGVNNQGKAYQIYRCVDLRCEGEVEEDE